MADCVKHCLQRASAPVDAERNGSVFMADDPLDQRVLYACIPEVVDEGVTEAVECLPGVCDPLAGSVATEPL